MDYTNDQCKASGSGFTPGQFTRVRGQLAMYRELGGGSSGSLVGASGSSNYGFVGKFSWADLFKINR
jgi:hypothetical protein